MSATITNWPITLEQFLSLPEAKPALEMGCNGEISQKVSPTSKHAVLQSEFAIHIGNYARTHALGRVFTEQRVVLSRVTRVADVSFYRQARLPLDAAGHYIDHPTTPPDLVVEIYSPGQESRGELVARAAWYVEQGVRVVLLVDPDRRRVTAFTANAEAVFETSEPLPLDDILPGLQLTPAELFGVLDP